MLIKKSIEEFFKVADKNEETAKELINMLTITILKIVEQKQNK